LRSVGEWLGAGQYLLAAVRTWRRISIRRAASQMDVRLRRGCRDEKSSARRARSSELEPFYFFRRLQPGTRDGTPHPGLLTTGSSSRRPQSATRRS
jgi:hypothetical protein